MTDQWPLMVDRLQPRRWLLSFAYLVAFVTLDWASYIRPLQGLNITPWNPQPALAIALLMWQPRRKWLVWVGLVAAELIVRGVPVNPLAALAATAALTLTYAAIARALKQRVGTVAPFRTRSDVFWFAVIVACGSLVSAVLYVIAFSSALTVFAAADSPTGAGAVARYWIGDAVGLIVTLPVLLSAHERAPRAALAGTLRSPEWWAAALATGASVLLVFGSGEQNYFKYFYVLLLPVVWASARFGVPGAVLSSVLTQLGLIAGAQFALQHDLTLFELQALLVALTLTALLVGVLVDERAQAAIELRNSLRLAAAGQMTAALAHELSQPLTALSNYAEACRVLAGGDSLDDQQRQRLTRTLASLSAEAQRASLVIKRLRDFFRSGSTSLVRVNPAPVWQEAVEAQAEYARRRGVLLAWDIAPQLPQVWMDPVQIAVVVRNLIVNALESASVAPRGEVRVRGRPDRMSVVLEVHDNGSGIEADRLSTLFDASPSTKAGGLGVGLSICRAIIEAHGGKLRAEPAPGGHFLLTLPTDDHGPGTDHPS